MFPEAAGFGEVCAAKFSLYKPIQPAKRGSMNNDKNSKVRLIGCVGEINSGLPQKRRLFKICATKSILII